MAIEKINFSYPKGSLQSVFDHEEMTALELAAKTSKKVDECIELVNGVEQSAIEATAVVDEMRIAQDQFITENNDIRQQLVVDNQNYLDTTKASMDLALSTYQTTATDALNTFTAEINTTKAQIVEDANNVIINAGQQITTDVGAKIETMVTNGTLANIINNELLATISENVAQNEVIVAELAPTQAHTWLEVVGETTIEIDGENLVFEEI
jgi:hypothetical protein